MKAYKVQMVVEGKWSHPIIFDGEEALAKYIDENSNKHDTTFHVTYLGMKAEKAEKNQNG